MATNKSSNFRLSTTQKTNLKKSAKLIGSEVVRTEFPTLGSTILPMAGVISNLKRNKNQNKAAIKNFIRFNERRDAVKNYFANLGNDIKQGILYKDEFEDFDDSFGDMYDEYGDEEDFGDYEDQSFEEDEADMISNGFRDTGKVIGESMSAMNDSISQNYAKSEIMNAKYHAEIMASTGNIQKLLEAQISFNLNEVNRFIDSTNEYQQNMMDKLDKISENIQSMADSQARFSKGNRYERDPSAIEELFGSGNFELSAYGNNIKNRFKQSTGALTMAKMFFDAVKENPIGELSKTLLPALIPKNVKKSAKGLDDTFNSFLAATLVGLDTAGMRSSNPLLSAIGKIFGVSANGGIKPQTSSYKDEAITLAVENKKVKAITEVIPQYLQVMTKAMTGIDKVYDYEKGQFIDRRKRDNSILEDRRSSAAIAMDSSRDILMAKAEGLGAYMSRRDQENLRTDIDNVLLYIASNPKITDYEKIKFEDIENSGIHLSGGRESFYKVKGIIRDMNKNKSNAARFKREQISAYAQMRSDNARKEQELIFNGGIGYYNGFYERNNMLYDSGMMGYGGGPGGAPMRGWASPERVQNTKPEKITQKMKQAQRYTDKDWQHRIAKISISEEAMERDKAVKNAYEWARNKLDKSESEYTLDQFLSDQYDDFCLKYAKNKETFSFAEFKALVYKNEDNGGIKLKHESEDEVFDFDVKGFVNKKLKTIFKTDNKKLTGGIIDSIVGEKGVIPKFFDSISNKMSDIILGTESEEGIFSSLFTSFKDLGNTITSNIHDIIFPDKEKDWLKKTKLYQTLWGKDDDPNDRGILGGIKQGIIDKVTNPISKWIDKNIAPKLQTFFEGMRKDVYQTDKVESNKPTARQKTIEDKKKEMYQRNLERANMEIAKMEADGAVVSEEDKERIRMQFTGQREIKHFAEGGISEGETHIIGENGPELAYLPKGTIVKGNSGGSLLDIAKSKLFGVKDKIADAIQNLKNKRATRTEETNGETVTDVTKSIKDFVENNSEFSNAKDFFKGEATAGILSTLLTGSPVPGMLIKTLISANKWRKQKVKDSEGKEVELDEDGNPKMSLLDKIKSEAKGPAISGIVSTVLTGSPVPGLLINTLFKINKKRRAKAKENPNSENEQVELDEDGNPKLSFFDKLKKGAKGPAIAAGISTILTGSPVPGLLVSTLLKLNKKTKTKSGEIIDDGSSNAGTESATIDKNEIDRATQGLTTSYVDQISDGDASDFNKSISNDLSKANTVQEQDSILKASQIAANRSIINSNDKQIQVLTGDGKKEKGFLGKLLEGLGSEDGFLGKLISGFTGSTLGSALSGILGHIANIAIVTGAAKLGIDAAKDGGTMAGIGVGSTAAGLGLAAKGLLTGTGVGLGAKLALGTGGIALALSATGDSDENHKMHSAAIEAYDVLNMYIKSYKKKRDKIVAKYTLDIKSPTDIISMLNNGSIKSGDIENVLCYLYFERGIKVDSVDGGDFKVVSTHLYDSLANDYNTYMGTNLTAKNFYDAYGSTIGIEDPKNVKTARASALDAARANTQNYTIPGYANGGIITSPVSIVGERGPELLIGGEGGNVIPNVDGAINVRLIGMLPEIASSLGGTRNIFLNSGSGVATASISYAVDMLNYYKENNLTDTKEFKQLFNQYKDKISLYGGKYIANDLIESVSSALQKDHGFITDKDLGVKKTTRTITIGGKQVEVPTIDNYATTASGKKASEVGTKEMYNVSFKPGSAMSMMNDTLAAAQSAGIISAPIKFTDLGDIKHSDTADNKAKYIYKKLHNMGIPDTNIAGLLGNWYTESNFDFSGVEGIYDEPNNIGPKKMAAITNSNDYMINNLFKRYDQQGIKVNKNAYKFSDGRYFPGIGLAGFTGPTAEALINHAKKSGKQWYDIDAQLDYAVNVMKPNFFKTWSQESSPEQAAYDFLRYYEFNDYVPKTDCYMDRRKSNARRYYDMMADWAQGRGASDIVKNWSIAGRTIANKSGELMNSQIASSGSHYIPYYSQLDSKWKDVKYGYYNGNPDTIGAGGCGPAVAAMMFEGLTGIKRDPRQMSIEALNHGFKSNGTSAKLFEVLGQEIGVPMSIANGITGDATFALRYGVPVALIGKNKEGKAPFGYSNHYVLGTMLNNNGISIYDPINPANNKRYDINALAPDVLTSITPQVNYEYEDEGSGSRVNIPTGKVDRALMYKNSSKIDHDVDRMNAYIDSANARGNEDSKIGTIVAAILEVAKEMSENVAAINESMVALADTAAANSGNASTTKSSATTRSAKTDSSTKKSLYNQAISV